MVFHGAWVAPPSADDKLSAIARRVLIERIHTVYCMAPLAAHFDQVDVEFVHQLRVATRRAHAAIQLFRPLLPQRRRTRWSRQLRIIRRAAGPARNLDVLLLRWQDQGGNGLSPPEAFLDGVRTCRVAVQRSLRKTIDEIDWADYYTEWQALLTRIRWRDSGPEPAWSTAAVAWMHDPFRQYFTAGQKLLQRTAADYDIDDLHAFRIRGKRLRYALEICESAFSAAAYQPLGRKLKRIQDRLGKINDHATALRQLDQWRACGAFQGMERDLNQLTEVEDAALRHTARRFLAKWSSAKLQQLRLAWRACRSRRRSPK